jgi:uncharacterized RDD family membrane protein YckC
MDTVHGEKLCSASRRLPLFSEGATDPNTRIDHHQIGVVRRRAATLLDVILSACLLFGVCVLEKGYLQKLLLHPSAGLHLWMNQHPNAVFGGDNELLEREYPDMPQDLRAEFLALSKESNLAVWTLALLALWLYHALLEAKLATPGKLLLGLRVCDRNGQRISISRASVRLLGKLLLLFLVGVIFGLPLFLGATLFLPANQMGSAMIGIGVILFLLLSIPFTRKTTTLYDGLAGCVVLRKR